MISRLTVNFNVFIETKDGAVLALKILSVDCVVIIQLVRTRLCSYKSFVVNHVGNNLLQLARNYLGRSRLPI